jgi:hypothetical protein
VEFLRETLTANVCEASAVEEEALRRGITRYTLHEAKNYLKIKPIRTSLGNNGAGGWWWTLPGE